jgi:hypothetical protein
VHLVAICKLNEEVELNRYRATNFHARVGISQWHVCQNDYSIIVLNCTYVIVMLLTGITVRTRSIRGWSNWCQSDVTASISNSLARSSVCSCGMIFIHNQANQVREVREDWSSWSSRSDTTRGTSTSVQLDSKERPLSCVSYSFAMWIDQSLL